MDSVRPSQAKKHAKKKKKNKAKHRAAATGAAGFVRASAPGCHVADSRAPPAWVLGCEPFDPEDYGLSAADTVPDLTIDPDDGVLTVLNAAPLARSYYLSTQCACLDAAGVPLATGYFRDRAGRAGQCCTFILTLGPRVSLSVCRIAGAALYSHVSDLALHPAPAAPPAEAAVLEVFPLGGAGPFLCSQAHGGCLTHFTASTHHAVDLQCPVGTPVLSVGAGTVAEVRDRETCSGVWAENLFHWNSVLLRLHTGLYVEYVHLRVGSARVLPGEAVEAGQVLAESGDAGFCPVPHLHLQCHSSDAPAAHTVPFAFRGPDGAPYVPVCGRSYPPQ